MIIQCPECGEKVSDKVKKCPHCGVRLKNKSYAGLIYTFLALIIVLVLGGIFYFKYLQHQHEEDKFETAMHSNDVGVLQDYIDLNPDAPESKINAVKKRLEVLKIVEDEWYDAAETQSRPALQSFIRKHPDSQFAESARIMIDSIDWQTAKRQNTEMSYKTYMEHHRDGQYYYDAETAIDNLAAQRQAEEERQRAIDDSLDAAKDKIFQP